MGLESVLVRIVKQQEDTEREIQLLHAYHSNENVARLIAERTLPDGRKLMVFERFDLSLIEYCKDQLNWLQFNALDLCEQMLKINALFHSDGYVIRITDIDMACFNLVYVGGSRTKVIVKIYGL